MRAAGPKGSRITPMLRISHESTTDAQVTVRLEGEINGRWVEELRRECDRTLRRAVQDDRRLVLDLADVSSIDAEGLALLRELNARRLVVTNCSPYLAELLKDLIDVER
jgi:anti-anti-sigma factor